MALPPVPPPPVTGNRAFDAWAYLMWQKLGAAGLLAPDLSIGGNADSATSATTAVTAVTATTADSALGLDASYTVPIAQGGTNATTAAGARTELGVVSTSDIRTKRATLTSPGTPVAGDFEDTIVPWDTPMPDATYAVQLTFIDAAGLGGAVSVVSQLAASVTVRLTNTQNDIAAGEVYAQGTDI